MNPNLDVNPAFDQWQKATGRDKEWALTELARKMESYAGKICWLKIPDHKDEFDALVNGIVWRAIRKLDKFKGESKFSTWFHRIVLNECNRYLRAFKTRCEEELTEDIAIGLNTVDCRIDLLDLLNRLEGLDHLLFRLVAEGQDFKTIGKALGVGSHAALMRWVRLKERLGNAV